jgi:toxin secretion/phage lysis holin
MKETLCFILGGITTALVYLLGGFDIALQCLLIAIALDYVSGIIKAFTTKTLSSRIGFSGIVKKLGILLLVMVSVLVDRVSGNTGAIRTLVIYYFVANEGLSIVENLSIAGIPIPKGLKNALKVIRKESEDGLATSKTIQHKANG